MPSSPETDGAAVARAAAIDDAAHPAGGGAADRDRLRAQVDEVRQELARMDDRHKRALADLENYRKRSAREVERRVGEERERLLRDWLDVVDSVDRALAIEHDAAVSDGLRAVMDQMQSVLARHGAQRLAPVGERFDPEQHEAVATHATADAEAGTILDVARAGYRLGDRVLRPAQVVVATAAGGES
jgi:molecular chaperone GrpE